MNMSLSATTSLARMSPSILSRPPEVAQSGGAIDSDGDYDGDHGDTKVKASTARPFHNGPSQISSIVQAMLTTAQSK